jgi:hypothetical protein
MLNLKNLQAAARRRGLSLHKSSSLSTDPDSEGFTLHDGNMRTDFGDLTEVRDELRARNDQCVVLRRRDQKIGRKVA